MYTEPKIFTSNDLNTRSYITFYFYGKRMRIYNGHSLGKKINPNHVGNLKDRNRLLDQLLFELKTALANNTYPVIKEQPVKVKPVQTISTREILKSVLDKKLNSDLSKFYKRNLKYIHQLFIEFLTNEELNADIGTITLNRIEEFLSKFSSSGTYYMDKRRDLGVLFSSAGKSLQIDLKVIRKDVIGYCCSRSHFHYQ